MELIETEQQALVQLGLRLRAARQRQGDRQSDAAARLGVSTLSYRRMESGFAGSAIGPWVRALRLYGELSELDALLPASLFELDEEAGRDGFSSVPTRTRRRP